MARFAIYLTETNRWLIDIVATDIDDAEKSARAMYPNAEVYVELVSENSGGRP